MMNTSPDDKRDFRSKLQINPNNNNDDDDDRLSKALARAASSSSATTTTSRQWAGFKNPRIVRVSRTFGGKDRHSKVCTIRGLRDRRIRLSVPTAIQLYDLQDRLGLSQPSKVIDWLLDATKLDIDKLPPLQIPPGNFVDFHQQSLFGQLPNPNATQTQTQTQTHHFTPFLDAGPSNEGININDDVDVDEDDDEDTKWSRRSGASASVSGPQSFFPMAGLMNSAGMMAPYGNMYHWDPSNLSLSQFGSHGSSSHQAEEAHQMSNNYSSTPQLFFCPPLATTSSLFPQHENRFQMSNSYGSALRDFVPHEQMHSGESNAAGQQQDKGDTNN